MRKHQALAHILVLVIIAAIALTACSQEPQQPTPQPTQVPTEPHYHILPNPATIAHMPSMADTVEKAQPAVVSIVVYHDTGSQDDTSDGTGIIIDPKGLVITNNHVIDQSHRIIVTTHTGDQIRAKILGTDRLSDLAILWLPQGPTYPFMQLDPTIQIRPGEWVVAIGNALALPGGPTVTVGVVSALGRTIDSGKGTPLYNLVQTDTSINPGNSGGPLINSKGDLIGINTAIIRRNKLHTGNFEGIGFAIHAKTAAKVTTHLTTSGTVPWAWMGLFMKDLTPAEANNAGVTVRQGVLISDVVEAGPAHKAGLKKNDIITSIDGIRTPTLVQLIQMLRDDLAPDQKIKIRIIRNGNTEKTELTLGIRPTS